MSSGTERPPATDATDRDLVRRAMGGDKAAFDALYRRYWSFRRNFLRRFPSPEDLDDAYQTIFFRLLNRFINRGGFTEDGMAAPSFFVRYLTVSLAHAGQAACEARQRRAAGGVPDHLPARPEADDPAAAVERVVNALVILNAEDQDLIIRHYLGDQSREALAKEFTLGLAAVHKRFARAFEALRRHFGLEPPPGGRR